MINDKAVAFGVNLNSREPLIAPDYQLGDLLRLAMRVEELGFDSIWIGDSLFSKPRYEAMTLLAALSQRTSSVRLGTACLVSSTRNPLYLALQWATLDRLSNGRTIFGPCMGNPEQGVRREFAALGLEYKERAAIFEEGLRVLRSLWTEGKVDLDGRFFHYDDVSFYSGTEMEPLRPLQTPPPMWVVSNPTLFTAEGSEQRVRALKRACRRIIELGDGWMTCCRAQHPEELSEQVGYLEEAAHAVGKSLDDYTVSYQITLNIADSTEEALHNFGEYISKYFPEQISEALGLSNWGPVGTPDAIIDWLRTFADRGVGHFICKFGDLDQFGQVERFSKEVLPAFRL